MIYKIFVDHIYSRIEGELSRGLLRKLYKLCAFHPKGYQFMPSYRQMIYRHDNEGNVTEKYRAWDGYISFFRKDSQSFHTGFLKYVLKLFDENNIKYEIVDNRDFPPIRQKISLKLNDHKKGSIELRDYQIKALKRSLLAHRGIIKVSTGGGKSEIAASIIKNIDQPTLYFVHQQTLALQTKERFEERLGQKIGLIGIGKFEPEKVNIAMIETFWIQKHTARIKKLMKDAKVVIFDECHHLKAKTWSQLANRIKAPYRYGLSATPELKGEGKRLVAVTGHLLINVKTQKLIKKGYLAEPLIKVYNFKCEKIKGVDYQTARQEGIVYNYTRNEGIIRTIDRYIKKKKSILILITEIEHGQTLSDMIKEQYKDIKIEYLYGKDSADKRKTIIKQFKNKEVDILIGSVIFDEGVDIPSLEVLVLANGQKSEIKNTQRVGRSLRRDKGKDKVIIIDFYDDHNKYLLEHSKERIKNYKRNKFKIKFIKG